MIRLLIFTIAASLAIACSDEPNDPGTRPDATTDAGPSDAGDVGSLDGSTPDSGDPDAGPSDFGPRVPITDRPNRGDYTCRVERDRTDHTPRVWGDGMSMAVTSGGVGYFARIESMPPAPFDPAPLEFLVSTFAPDGTFGAPMEPSSGDAETITGAHLIRSGDGLALVWVEGSRLRFATLSASGQPVISERDLASGTVDYLANPKIAAGPGGGFGIVYSVDEGGNRRIRFLELDAGGVEVGTAIFIGGATSGGGEPAATIAATADGYGLLWRDQENNRGRIIFAKVAPGGAVTVPPLPINGVLEDGVLAGGAVGFDRPTVALLSDGDGYVAAWPEHFGGEGGFATMGAWSVVKVARLGAAGDVVVPPVELRAKTLEKDEVEPTLVHFGNDVAVLWGRGSHIYFCGGCTPDNRIDLLILDPLTLDPISNVVTVDRTGTGGGLMRREVAVTGSSLLVAFRLTFHVSSTAGSATFVCD